MNFTEGLILRTGVTRDYLEKELGLTFGEILVWFDEDDHRAMFHLLYYVSIEKFVKFCVEKQNEKHDRNLWKQENDPNLIGILSILIGRREIKTSAILDAFNKSGLVVNEDDLKFPHKIINKLNVPDAFANKEKLVIDFLKRSFPWD